MCAKSDWRTRVMAAAMSSVSALVLSAASGSYGSSSAEIACLSKSSTSAFLSFALVHWPLNAVLEEAARSDESDIQDFANPSASNQLAG